MKVSAVKWDTSSVVKLLEFNSNVVAVDAEVVSPVRSFPDSVTLPVSVNALISSVPAMLQLNA